MVLQGRRTLVITFATLAGIAAMVGGSPSVAAPDVQIQSVSKRATSQRIILKNNESTSVDIGGWVLRGDLDEFEIPSGITIGASGGRVRFKISPIASASGKIQLIDDLKAFRGEEVVDQVRFGCEGGAPAIPAAPDSAALVRAPDPSFFPPTIPLDDENYWTIDLDYTENDIVNNAPDPSLGSSLMINEVQIGDGVLHDFIELYNPSGGLVSVDGWFAYSSAGVVFLTGSVGPFDVTEFDVDGLDLAIHQRVDLFDADSVRVDQKAVCGASPRRLDTCYGSCPDGGGSVDGYDYLSSGGGVTWFPLPCTLGDLNSVNGSVPCVPSSVPEDPPADPPEGTPPRQGSWGRLKSEHR